MTIKIAGYTQAFADAVEKVLEVEQGFSDHPLDRGGPTNWGITERVARANGYMDDMAHMPKSVAVSIYKLQYWDTQRLTQIASISTPIAREMFDTGVNTGIGRSATFLQRCLNVLDKAGLTVDGMVGPMTVFALSEMLKHRGAAGEEVLLRALNSLQGAFYIEMAEHDPTQRAFAYGWMRERVT